MNSIKQSSLKPRITFLIRSDTVNIDHYTIKDIPGSSGRLDVVARSILAALMNQKGFDKNIQIIIFLNRYGAFKFNSTDLNDAAFPKDELQLSNLLYDLIKNRNNPEYLKKNPVGSIERYHNSIIHYIKNIRQQDTHDIFVLKESSPNLEYSLENLRELVENEALIFIVGNQSEDFINSDTFLSLNLRELSLGAQSYLASSVIRLIKLNVLHLNL